MQIICCDDDPEQLELLARLLRRSNHDVKCLDPVELLEQLDARTLDAELLICDVDLGVCNGFEVKRRLNAERKRPIPTIFISGSAIPQNLLTSRSVGALAFLKKPVEADDLLLAVRKSQIYRQKIALSDKEDSRYLDPIAQLEIFSSGDLVTLMMRRSYTVGRDASCDVVIPQHLRAISNRHCLFHRRYEELANGNWESYYLLIDGVFGFGVSTYGTLLNGERITKAVRLQHDDLIEIPAHPNKIVQMRYKLLDAVLAAVDPKHTKPDA